MISLILVIATASTAFASHVPTHAVPVAAVPSTYHHVVVPAPTYVANAVPAVSHATRVTSYQTTQPGVPRTVAKVSTYTPAATAVHTAHASVPTAVASVVHHAPAYNYGYYPVHYGYTHRYNYHPLIYGYVHGLSPYGLSYGYVSPVKK
ncbi:uncharacterized protein LOC142803253 [Rhipicephalus microplus]|uniref:uncharacterized protein LOC142803253 n=1 Tax=Rhipicephalus microplus TaxID=6941 RepID=UPI003F6B4CAB